MRSFLLILAIVAAAAAAAASQAGQPPAPPAPAGIGAPLTTYMCPMHPDELATEPRKCSRCGMDLVPIATSSYVCPMHPDEMSATPGKCSRCAMDLVPGSPVTMPDFRLHVETTPRVLKAGQPVKFRFTAHHPLTGAAAQEFATVHEKLFHLFIISRDLDVFAHIHPEAHPDGSFSIEHTLPKPGHYMLFADFLPIGGGAQITGLPFATVGVDTDLTAARATLTPDAALVQTADDVRVEIVNQRSEILGGEEVDLVFRFTDVKTEAPVTDLQTYLGAAGHLVILSEDMLDYVHAHPREDLIRDPSAPVAHGPDVLFDALLPRPGHYRAWLQFQRHGRLSTVTFTFAASAPGAMP